MSPIEAIKKAVAENRTSDALSALLELSKSDKDLHDSILIFSGEFKELTSQRLKGTIDNSEATRRTAVIHDKILVALGAFDSEGRVLPGSVVEKKGSATNLLGKLTLLFLAGIGLPQLLVYLLYGLDPFRGFRRDEFTEGCNILSSFCGILVFFTFIAYLLALVVSAFKK